MKYFLDWARTKDVAMVAEDGSEQLVMVKQLTFEEGDEIYIESGFSNRVIEDLMVQGCTVYCIDAHTASEHRTEEKKSDIEDARWLHILYSNQPDLFVQVQPLSDEDRELKRLYAMYRQVTRDIVRFKNIRTSMQWEHGKTAYGAAIADLGVFKKEIFKEMKPLIKDDLKKVRELGIKGIGPMLFAQLMAVAHPKNFSSKSKYLAYCGCKARTFYKTFENGVGRGRGRFNRNAAMIGYLIADAVIRATDPKYYQFYLEVKEKFKQDNPEWPNGVCHGKAKNRLRTMLMKEVYQCLAQP